MKNRNNHQLSKDKGIKLEHSSKFFTLGVTPTNIQQDIRSSLRKQGTQSKGFDQGSTMTSPKNVSTNSKKSQHSSKIYNEGISQLQKFSISGSIKPKKTDGSLLEKKRMKQNASRYERRQDQKMKLSVMKSLANVININDFHSSVNISEVAQLTICSISKNDFNFVEIIGRGTFGNVWKVQQRKTLKFYALKEMSKAIIIINKSVQNIMNQKKILLQFHHPFINKMYGSFTDRDNLYLVLQLLQGGDLRYHMNQHKRFTEQQGKFFIACIIESLQALSTKKIAHRDLKPQNIVFDEKGYLKLTDFGISKQDYTCDTSGTPGYMAPQVLCRLVHNSVADYFALGIVAYQIMTGKRPYNGHNRNQIRQSILSKQVNIKKGDRDFRWSGQGVDFINKLIQRQPNFRLGYNGIFQLKQHSWFRKFNWKKLINRQMNPPFFPQYSLRINDQNTNKVNTQILMKHRLLERFSNHNEIFEQYYEPFRQDTYSNDQF